MVPDSQKNSEWETIQGQVKNWVFKDVHMCGLMARNINYNHVCIGY